MKSEPLEAVGKLLLCVIAALVIGVICHQANVPEWINGISVFFWGALFGAWL